MQQVVAEGVRPDTIAAIASAVAAIVAAGVAIVQVRLQVSVTKKEATFAHIRDISSALHHLRDMSVDEAQATLNAFYVQDVPLTDRGRQYIGMLDQLDLLALAYEERAVDQRIVEHYFGHPFRSGNLVSRDLIAALQILCDDPTVYEHLDRLITRIQSMTENKVDRSEREIRSFPVLKPVKPTHQPSPVVPIQAPQSDQAGQSEKKSL
jgi:hypothetical protein